MKNIPLPTNESGRIKALESYSIMDTLPEKEYDAITQLASYICGTPIALVSLLDKDRQWFKSIVGLGAAETPRDISFCQYAIMGDEVYEVANALENKLFADNPLVTGNPDIRFYAGAPLKDEDGFNLGSLCVIDTVPRVLNDEQKNTLKLLANQVVLLLQLRKKNEDLYNTQKEFQNFIELSKDLVCIAKVNGIFYKVNPAFSAVLGYSKVELEGMPFIDLVHPDDVEKTLKEVVKLAEGHKTISFENRYRCNNGEYVVLSWNASPDPVSGNLYCIARDITLKNKQRDELNKTLLNLKKKNDELDQFAYLVSHDLKAPLRAIYNLSEWISEDMPDMPKDIRSNFDLLRGRVFRMENLINGVLEYSRIGSLEIQKETIDLKLMLSQTIDSLVPRNGFEITTGSNFPVIISERILLQQVFDNLISNAVNYNNKPLGKIEFHYKLIGGFHQFTIKDNGPGIAKEYHEKVFKVFQTIEARDVKESTGIGLSIVKKIIEEKGGHIFIESEPNQGCSFIFSFPK